MTMLTLSGYGIEPDIEVEDGTFYTLSVENKDFLLTVLSDIRNQSEGDKDGNLNLLLNGRELNFEKNVTAVFDFTDIDFNAKSITNLLTKKFGEFLKFGEQVEALAELEIMVLNLTETFRIHSGLNIAYDAVLAESNLAKICSLKIADQKMDLLHRLCEYVSLMCELKPLKLFVLVFGKSFLSEEDIFEIYRYCSDKQVRLLFVEGVDQSKLLPNEKRLVIDEDLCSITQKI
jgi:CRISPR type II-A-associated protein Csn2